MTTPWHTLPGPLRPDVFQMQAVRFGAEISAYTGQQIDNWLKLLDTLGPSPSEAEQLSTRNAAIHLKNLFSMGNQFKGTTNHIRVCDELYGAKACNPFSGLSQDKKTRGLISELSERELQVLELLALGYNSPAIQKLLGIEETSVVRNYARLKRKFKESNLGRVVAEATECGILRPASYSTTLPIVQKLTQLSLDELKVLLLILEGLPTLAVAKKLNKEGSTVDNDLNAIYIHLLSPAPGNKRRLIYLLFNYRDYIEELIDTKKPQHTGR